MWKTEGRRELMKLIERKLHDASENKIYFVRCIILNSQDSRLFIFKP